MPPMEACLPVHADLEFLRAHERLMDSDSDCDINLNTGSCLLSQACGVLPSMDEYSAQFAHVGALR